MSRTRLPSKEARKQDELLRTLGYRLDRMDGGHLVYTHREQPVLVVGATPSDFRARRAVMAELRRRHPVFFARRKSTRPKRRKTEHLPHPAAFLTPLDTAVVVFGDRRRCVDCARPENDSTVTVCAGCGGPLAKRGRVGQPWEPRKKAA